VPHIAISNAVVMIGVFTVTFPNKFAAIIECRPTVEIHIAAADARLSHPLFACQWPDHKKFWKNRFLKVSQQAISGARND
jgi:hypothetical protein